MPNAKKDRKSCCSSENGDYVVFRLCWRMRHESKIPAGKLADKALKEALSDSNVAFHLMALPLENSHNYAPERKQGRHATQRRTNKGLLSAQEGQRQKQKGG